MYKILTCGLGAVLIWQLIQLAQLGRGVASVPPTSTVGNHRRKVWHVFWLTVIAILLIEWQVRISPDPHAVNMYLLVVHLTLDAILTALFAAIIIRFNGERSRTWHATIAYSFLLVYALVVVTGIILLYQIP